MDEPHASPLRTVDRAAQRPAPVTARPAVRSAARVARHDDPALARGFRTPVRGHAFAARPPSGAASLGRVRLVREPHNPADPWAVAVWTAEGAPWRIGYLDRSVAARVAPALDAGVALDVRLEGWVEAPGGWQRPLLAVAAGCRATAVAGRDARLWGRPPGVTRRTLPRR